jgi:hypothetical protein
MWYDSHQVLKRLPRILLNTLRALSLTLCLASLISIPLSFFRVASMVRTNQQSSEVLRVVTGFVTFHDQRGPGMVAFFGMTGQTPRTWQAGFEPVANVKFDWEYALLPRYLKAAPMTTPSGSLDHRMLIVPLWLLAAVFSLPKTLPVVMRRLRHRPRPGACPNCGYDLRATPERCPECGTVPTR